MPEFSFTNQYDLGSKGPVIPGNFCYNLFGNYFCVVARQVAWKFVARFSDQYEKLNFILLCVTLAATKTLRDMFILGCVTFGNFLLWKLFHNKF